MKEKDPIRSKWLHLRLTEAEYERIEKKFERSTCRKLSEYARCVLLDKVITVNTRNQSLDECIEELIRLREELSLLSERFEEAIKRLHVLEKKEEYKAWLLLYETSRKILLQKVDTIKEKTAQISEVWLQS